LLQVIFAKQKVKQYAGSKKCKSLRAGKHATEILPNKQQVSAKNAKENACYWGICVKKRK